MTMSKEGILLVNLGTPKAPTTKEVKRFITEFLTDRRVIELPSFWRHLLVKGIIAPFRSPKSAKAYKRLWKPEGSPILKYGKEVQKKLQEKIGITKKVYLGMRYGEPSLKKVLKTIYDDNIHTLTIIPLFPQYASATTGSTLEIISHFFSKKDIIPNIRIISEFHDHPALIKAFSTQGQHYTPKKYDHILFSFHGLPSSQINRLHPGKNEKHCSCKEDFQESNRFCYKASCYNTARLIAKELEIPKENYSVAFQSRFAKDWLAPFTDKEIIRFAKEGKKRLLVFSPAFVADCLETVIEINDYQPLFKKYGGEHLQLVESLNASEVWIEALYEILS